MPCFSPGNSWWDGIAHAELCSLTLSPCTGGCHTHACPLLPRNTNAVWSKALHIQKIKSTSLQTHPLPFPFCMQYKHIPDATFCHPHLDWATKDLVSNLQMAGGYLKKKEQILGGISLGERWLSKCKPRVVHNVNDAITVWLMWLNKNKIAHFTPDKSLCY